MSREIETFFFVFKISQRSENNLIQILEISILSIERITK